MKLPHLLLLLSLVLLTSLEILLTIYLMKSSLNIDLFDNYSLGLWRWFDNNILHLLN
jgi:hypothetical protein